MPRLLDSSGLRRLWAMIVKEMWAVLRDPKARIVLVIPPLLQLFIFTYATTLDVRNVDVGLFDRSSGVHSSELVSRIAGSPRFREIVPLRSPDALRKAIDEQQVIAAIVIDEDFDRRIVRGETARVGLVLDGRRSNAAQIVSAYLSQIVGGVGADLIPCLESVFLAGDQWGLILPNIGIMLIFGAVFFLLSFRVTRRSLD